MTAPARSGIFGFDGLAIGQSLPQSLSTISTKRFEIRVAAGQAAIDRRHARPVSSLVDAGFELIPGQTA